MVTFPAVPPPSPSHPYAMTVGGQVAVADLGIALPHEHLLIHIPDFIDLDEETLRGRQNEPVTLENLGWVRQHWTYSRDNLRMTSEPLATAEIARFAAAGGSTVVDVTVPGLGRDPEALARISRATGLHIVMACGAYVAKSHPAWVRDATESQLADVFIAEARDGVGVTRIRPGIIKIGCTWPLDPNEEKALHAAAYAQQRTGLSISLHPGRNRAAPLHIAKILADHGADLRRVVMGHLDGRVQDLDGLRQLGALGLFLELDVFGMETSYFPVPGVTGLDGLSDAQRLALVRGLIDAGLGSQVLVSHDIGTKHRLAAYGGHGFDHLLSNVIPWMRQKGFTDDEIDMVFIRNPGRALAVHQPRD
jgi:phosphotriesterase-related protein